MSDTSSRCLVLVLATSLVLELAAEPARGQSRIIDRSRTYMLDHCLEITAKQIDTEVPMTIGLKSGESLRASFVRTQGDTLVVRVLEGENVDWAPSTFHEQRIASLRFTNRPTHNVGFGVLGFVAGYTVSALAMVTVMKATDHELSYADWPLIVGGLVVGSSIGFAIGYTSTMRNPGESTILCR